MLAKPESAVFVNRLGLADATIEIDKHVFDRPTSLLRPRNLAALLKLATRVRTEKAETVVLFGHLVTWFGAIKYALLAFASGARARVGLDNGRGWFLTQAVRDEGFGVRHEVEYWLQLAALLDAPGEPILEAPISSEERTRSAELLAPVLRKPGILVGVHPSTGWYSPGRKWSPARFAETVDLLAASGPLKCVVLGGKGDKVDADRMIRAGSHPVLSLVGCTTVGELGAILERCDVLIANDGGVAHLAAAVGTPVVAVFGPSNDRAWRPVGSTVVAADLPCRPCLYRGFETGLRKGCGTRHCMELVMPRDVARVTEDLLASTGVSAV